MQFLVEPVSRMGNFGASGGAAGRGVMSGVGVRISVRGPLRRNLRGPDGCLGGVKGSGHMFPVALRHSWQARSSATEVRSVPTRCAVADSWPGRNRT